MAAALALAVCGCSQGDESPIEANRALPPGFARANEAQAAPEAGSLELELLSESWVQLVFGERHTIRARLTTADGEPLAGAGVSFALVGRSQDSSLTSVNATTAADGSAENTLIAGEMPAAFSVRISAPGAFEQLVEIGVSNAGFGTLLVDAGYHGARTVLQRVVFAQAGMTCRRAERTAGDPMVTLGHETENVARFLALPAGVSYAVLAFAEGKGGAVVASGCTEAEVARADTQVMAVVDFADEPLMPLYGRFMLDATLDATAPALTLGGALRGAAEALVQTDAMGRPALEAAEARFLLDSLDSTLRSKDYNQQPGALTLADALAQERAMPTGDRPEHALQSLLEINGEGALSSISRLVALTSAGLETLELSVELSVDPDGGELPVSWQAQRIEAVQDEGAPISLELLEHDPVETQASLLPDRDAIDLASVRFEVPLGTLTLQVLQRMVSFDATGHGAEIRDGIGCATLAEWLDAQSYAQSGVCGAACVQAACDRAVPLLVSAAETALLALDGTRPTLSLHGELALGDEDGDLLAERMSTDLLAGEWDAETEGEAGDPVSGTATASAIATAVP